ncbi:hypothetical protein Gotur_025089 [Gossypium turneri]
MRGIPHLVSTDQSNNKVKNDETSRSMDQPVSAAIDECSANGKKYEPMESSCCNSFQRKGLMTSVIWLMVRIREPNL